MVDPSGYERKNVDFDQQAQDAVQANGQIFRRVGDGRIRRHGEEQRKGQLAVVEKYQTTTAVVATTHLLQKYVNYVRHVVSPLAHY